MERKIRNHVLVLGIVAVFVVMYFARNIGENLSTSLKTGDGIHVHSDATDDKLDRLIRKTEESPYQTAWIVSEGVAVTLLTSKEGLTAGSYVLTSPDWFKFRKSRADCAALNIQSLLWKASPVMACGIRDATGTLIAFVTDRDKEGAMELREEIELLVLKIAEDEKPSAI